MGVVTLTDRAKSVRNRCVIQMFVSFFCCQLVFEFPFDKGAFGIGPSQISFFFVVQIFRLYFS